METITGLEYLPKYNTLAVSLSDPKSEPMLAGNMVIPAEVVKIVSEPFKMKVLNVLKEYAEHEFILVQCNRGFIYLYLYYADRVLDETNKELMLDRELHQKEFATRFIDYEGNKLQKRRDGYKGFNR